MNESLVSNRDEALILQAVAGDRSALERLLLSRHDRLLAKLERRLPGVLRGAVGAEDLLQEVFIAAFRYIGEFKPSDQGAFDRWLSRIASRKLVSALRQARAQRRGGGRTGAVIDPQTPSGSVLRLLEVAAVNEWTPTRSVARHDAVRAMQMAMEEIDADYREVIQLRHIEGLSVAQTAERMGRSERAIEMLCHRAMRQLREAMGRSSRYFSSRE